MAERGQSEQPDRVGQGNPPQGDEASRVNSERSELEKDEASQRKGTANRGFAAMNSEKQKQIASEGGRAAHRQGVAHEWSKDEAREAGRKGGQMVSRNREHMSEIGRKGGQSSGQRRQRSGSEEA
ncbi:MAG TPA: KGG domain-containing protein [Chitinophagaceae bacterium]|jgi:general stress protein YciG|nr:KGG domain-containing protein [Chitinophagaceae bacterium]